MLKLFFLVALTIFIFLQTAPAYCKVSGTVSMQVSAILPYHVMSNNPGITGYSNTANQLVQTQIVIRNNKSISLTSIVVP